MVVSRREFVASLAAVDLRPAAFAVDVASGKILHSAPAGVASRIHPGSTAKPFTAVALIEAGEISPITCTGDLRIAGRRLACTHPTLAGSLELPVALAYSCNQFFANRALKLSPAHLTATMQRFGLKCQPPESPAQSALMGIGEWGVFATAPEIAKAYRRLALLSLDSADKYRALWDGMNAATEYGTARMARPAGVAVAGKTGTSPARNRSGSHALFAGWAPAGAPRVAVAVLAWGGGGGADAAPIARALFEKLL